MEGHAPANAVNDGEWTVVMRRKKRPAQRSVGDHMHSGGKERKCCPHKGLDGASGRGLFPRLEISTFVEEGQAFGGDVEINVEVTVEVDDEEMTKGPKSKKSNARMRDDRRGVRRVATVEERESRLLVQMHQARRMVEASPFYIGFLEQLRALHLNSRIHNEVDGNAVPASQSQKVGRLEGGSRSDATPQLMQFRDDLQKSHSPEMRDEESNGDMADESVPRGVGQTGGGVEIYAHLSESGCWKAASDFEYSLVGNAGVGAPVEGNAMEDDRGRRLLIVVYGVGSIADAEVSRCQMALACLMASELQVEGRVEVFDPVLSPMESRVLASLGASTIPHNEVGSRAVDGPTLFFMPHCEAHLYENVLLANREVGRFRQMAVLGNSFAQYQHRWTAPPYPNSKRPDFLLKIEERVEEHRVQSANFPVVSAFNDMSWHFFPNECASL